VDREGTRAWRVADRSPRAVPRGAVGKAVAGLLVVILLVLAGGPPAAVAAAAPNSLKLDATYNVSARIKWKRRKLVVSSTALVTNSTADSVSALTFNVVPAAIGRMVLNSVLAGPDADDELPADATVDDQSIIVSLPSPLDPGGQTAVTVNYTAWFGNTASNKGYLFEKANGVVTAYRWIPWLSVDYQFATPTFGEPFVTSISDEVDVTITADRPLTFATTGHETSVSDDGLTHTFVAHNVRDFNFSASPKYQTRTMQWGDVTVTWYYIRLSPDKLQKWTIAALERYTDRVGPYGYNYLNVAETGTFLGMESPGMVWISSTHPSLLKYLTVHEIAHEWFYAVVGNNQATQPFADEALAEFLTRDLIGQRPSNCAQDALDKSIYDYSADCYYETVYVEGDGYLDSYRQTVGDAAFWDGLRRYYQDYSFRMGGTKKLLDALDEAAGDAGADHSDYFPSLYPGAGG
jgi:hypothetical protein